MHATHKNFAAARRRSRCRGGFTLLELLVVAMLGVIVMTFISNAWRWYARGVNDVQVTAQLMRELRLAAETIAQDHGPAVAARTVDGTSVQFDFDSTGGDGTAQWGAPDTVIEYAVQGSQLVRKTLGTVEMLPLADHITDLQAEIVGGKLQVHLTAGYRDKEQELTLHLQDH